MKLKPGKCDYPLPDCGLLDSVYLDEGEREREGRGFVYQMKQVSPAEWAKMRGDPGKPALRAQPLYFAWGGRDIGLLIYPAPVAAHDLRVRYYPPMREA